EFARANAKGELRKFTPPGGPVFHALFTSKGGSVLLVDLLTYKWGMYILCTMVLKSTDMARTLERVQDVLPPDPAADSPFRDPAGFTRNDATGRRSFSLVLVDDDLLGRKIGTPLGFSALLFVSLTPKRPAQ
ncbi:MAG: hypothetical protein Q9M41_10570, partial [Paracoccaceae bacterium]|nr:hypothetical protein [Paracoccaceae bacterium]